MMGTRSAGHLRMEGFAHTGWFWRTVAIRSCRVFICQVNVLSPEKPQEVLEEKILQVWRVREEVPWEVTTSCLAENLLREVCALPFLRPTGIALASSLIEVPAEGNREQRGQVVFSAMGQDDFTEGIREGRAGGSNIQQ
ncbi:hypothetical protein GH733_000226 [Mirounga leonina]|nr:hypothetical protein GH733_000226 [Mirounga leonina]